MFRVIGSKNGVWFKPLGIHGEIQEIIFVRFGPLLSYRRETAAALGVLRVANNQYNGVFWPILRIRHD
jgi:hypothetical protein